MSRLRALLAILLAVTWCSAVWHVELEAVEMMLEHEHHTHDHHEQVVARDVAKDQVRASATTVAWITLLAFATWLVAAPRPPLVALRTLRQRRETDPPLAQAWQFMQRCVPESAAPPVLG